MKQHYVRTEISSAIAMTYGEHVARLHDIWGRSDVLPVPSTEAEAAREGYCVETVEQPTAENPGGSTSTTWMAKGEFERKHLAIGDLTGLEPHQQRMLAEYVALDSNWEGLNKFFKTDTFKALPFDEKERMLQQASAMNLYRYVLNQRIDALAPSDAA